ncbi:hypothetical protein EJ08DRAFT_647922 [Tothia fuscella]|uniref:Uncharacterized protein n=1 Tax=Tothia fuscella TaxID=1048955 RepID=A0A9P4U1B4_9PEZI|nr:hypothetical protein EJ08DRAFT_647922 [Tothia fuscella]
MLLDDTGVATRQGPPDQTGSSPPDNLPNGTNRTFRLSLCPWRGNMRNAIYSIISAIIIVVFFLKSNSSIASSARNMASSSHLQVIDPHPLSSTLQLSIAEKSPATSPPTILVTATNLHSQTSLTLLTWDSPFDDKALLLGVFRLVDLSNNEAVPSPNLRINRALPPPRDAFLEIRPRQAITKEIVLDNPAMKMQRGKDYSVQGKGQWKAVWHASVTDVGDDNLKKMGGGTGVSTWAFETEVVRIKT